MATPNCQTGRGKDGAAQSLSEEWLLWKGEVKELAHAQLSLVGVGLSYSEGISVKGRGCHFGSFTKWRHYYSTNFQ
jgi:hypothetical protein